MNEFPENGSPVKGPQEEGSEESPPKGVFASRLSLSHPAIRASAWTAASYAAGQALRFGSNLIMTRLLVPEAFGMMVIVNVIMSGLHMFSDFGLGPSIIQSPKGEEPAFLRTAWTVQIVRGILIWTVALALTWPLARFYGEPALLLLLPAIAFKTVVDAFTSTQTGALERRLEFGRLVVLDISCYALAIVVTILVALVWPSVWALVIGHFVYAGVSTVLTHFVLSGPRMRFMIDRAMAREMIRFGKWLFVSSVFAFLCGQLDRIVLGKFMTMTELGVYSIAFMFAQLMVQLVNEFTHSILFPVYSRAAEQSPGYLLRQTKKFRLGLMVLALPPVWFLVIFGPELIAFLYDDRYHAAGWVLQILAAGAIFRTVLAPVDIVLMASGDSYRHMWLQLARSLILIALMACGGFWYGTTGVIVAFAVSALVQYPVLVALVRRYGVWLPHYDLAALAISAAGVGLGFWVKTLILPG